MDGLVRGTFYLMDRTVDPRSSYRLVHNVPCRYTQQDKRPMTNEIR